MDEQQNKKHPAFGQVQVSVVSGHRDLFMVDYPQQNFITLRIKNAELRRDHSHDWVFGRETITEIALSEVQWARLIASPNTEGVPCTLTHYRDIESGKYVDPKMPDKPPHASAETFVKEVQTSARKVGTNVSKASAKLQEILAGGPVKKGDLQALREIIDQAAMDLNHNLSFVVEQAEQAIEKATESAKAEVDAHIDFSLMRLGERALGDRLNAAIESGIDPKAVGEKIADAVTLRLSGER